MPGEVERAFDLFDHHDHGVDQDHEADRAEHRRLRVLDELHDLDREFRAFLAERPQELEQHGLELAVIAESLEHRERDGDDRHQREQRRIHETHGAQAEVAAEQVAQQRVGVPQRGRGKLNRAVAGPLRPVEQPVLEAVLQRAEGGEGVGQDESIDGGRRKRCMARRDRQAQTGSRAQCRVPICTEPKPGTARPPLTTTTTRSEARYPTRIVCLTEETTEALYLMGEEDRIVGISGFTVRPPRARKEKPKVSAFISAKIDRILALEPDLVLGFSDLQADIASQLIRHGVEVHVFNQRSVDEILRVIRMLGGMIGCETKAAALAAELENGLDALRATAAAFPRRPRVYFEEWDEPQISGIRWVSELVGIAGGDDVFPELAACGLGKDRIITDPLEVVRRAPDIIFGSWCGKKFSARNVAARPGWHDVPAVRDRELHEVKSSIILQPGPAALTDGVRELQRVIAAWVAKRSWSATRRHSAAQSAGDLSARRRKRQAIVGWRGRRVHATTPRPAAGLRDPRMSRPAGNASDSCRVARHCVERSPASATR